MEGGDELLDDRFTCGLAIFCDSQVFLVVGGFGFWLLIFSRGLVGSFSTEAALSLSTLTTSSLPFSRIMNVLSTLFSTLKGPS